MAPQDHVISPENSSKLSLDLSLLIELCDIPGIGIKDRRGAKPAELGIPPADMLFYRFENSHS
jgi:hypothetical protein